ncbi:MAG: HEAT repeat domain-containing protein [Planctomycetes bacterium]|nr:HEAT repeat domain-containing protein [Planctomycetota bacterium]
MAKKHLISAVLVFMAGLFVAGYIFSAIPDKEWKQAQAEFLDEYNKAKTSVERAIAIRKLAETDHPGIVKVLIDTVLARELKENELLNIDIVASSLSRLSDPIAVDELITATKKTKLPEKIILIQSLGKISADGAKPLLLELLKNSDNLVKIAAIDALAESSPPEALDIITGCLESKAWEVKVSAISYLAKLKDDEAKQKALNVLRPRLNKETGRLRNDISEAINQLMVQTGTEGDNKNKMGGTFSFFDIPLEGDVVFVIDTSTSMEGKNKDGKDRWDKLVEQLKQSLEVMAKAKPAVKFNIIAYSERVGKFQDALVPVAENKEAAFKWLDGVKPGTMQAPGKLGAYTNIYDAVEMSLLGQSTAASQGQKIVITSGVPNPYTICLMTDGTANRGKYTNPDDILAALRILNQTRKIRINTIALDFGVAEAMGASGMGQMYGVDAALMEQIAKEHNGTCVKF